MDRPDRLRRALLTGSTPAARGVRFADTCLAVREIACGSCRDACPEDAIRFPPRRGIARPVLDSARCTTCGDCLPSCPVGAIALAAGDRA